MRLQALRGAISVDRNSSEAIRGATEWLMRELLKRNGLVVADIVSCIFTVTDDLDADFPAAAARNIGFEDTPLLCAREIPVPGALPRIVRVLVHYYSPHEGKPVHVYLGEARDLRRDLEAN